VYPQPGITVQNISALAVATQVELPRSVPALAVTFHSSSFVTISAIFWQTDGYAVLLFV
jgi:hypothetical protein